MVKAKERHALVDPREVEATTKPPDISLGIAPARVAPNTEYDGYRVKSNDGPEIYLVLFGSRRWIPNPTTYNNLFRDWNGILSFNSRSDLDNTIPQGPWLTDGAVLAKGESFAPVYLVTNGHKLWVTAPATMDKYNFAWNRIVVLPNVLIEGIPYGGQLI